MPWPTTTSGTELTSIWFLRRTLSKVEALFSMKSSLCSLCACFNFFMFWWWVYIITLPASEVFSKEDAEVSSMRLSPEKNLGLSDRDLSFILSNRSMHTSPCSSYTWNLRFYSSVSNCSRSSSCSWIFSRVFLFLYRFWCWPVNIKGYLPDYLIFSCIAAIWSYICFVLMPSGSIWMSAGAKEDCVLTPD